MFLAGLSAKLLHDMMQVLFALNETYYVGDGQNLDVAQAFRYRPIAFPERVRAILYPPPSENMLEAQRDAVIGLIDDIAQLVAEVEGVRVRLTSRTQATLDSVPDPRR